MKTKVGILILLCVFFVVCVLALSPQMVRDNYMVTQNWGLSLWAGIGAGVILSLFFAPIFTLFAIIFINLFIDDSKTT